MKNDFSSFFYQYLDQISKEINSYDHEEDIWENVGETKNSAGNLTLHILGNLNHFVGAALASNGYVRDRDAEFADKDVPRAKLLEEIEHVKALIVKTLPHLNNLSDSYPEGYWNDSGSIHFQLLRLLSHLAYHTGQINYHRRGFASKDV